MVEVEQEKIEVFSVRFAGFDAQPRLFLDTGESKKCWFYVNEAAEHDFAASNLNACTFGRHNYTDKFLLTLFSKVSNISSSLWSLLSPGSVKL